MFYNCINVAELFTLFLHKTTKSPFMMILTILKYISFIFISISFLIDLLTITENCEGMAENQVCLEQLRGSTRLPIGYQAQDLNPLGVYGGKINKYKKFYVNR